MAPRFRAILPTQRWATFRFRCLSTAWWRSVAIRSLTSNLEYRIPIVNQVTFAFFTDFGLISQQAKRPASIISEAGLLICADTFTRKDASIRHASYNGQVI
jgi:hypothetical protein